jgi:hypothetical protein
MESLSRFNASSRNKRGRLVEILARPVHSAVIHASIFLFAAFAVIISPAASGMAGAASDFNGPAGVAVSGNIVLVANGLGNSVTELNAATGSLIRVVKLASDDLNRPIGFAVRGNDAWVVNNEGSVITELNAQNGSLVRVIKLGAGQSGNAGAALSGSSLWVANNSLDTLFEFNTATGTEIRAIKANGLNGPTCVEVNGSQVWVGSVTVGVGGGNWLAEFNASNGSQVSELTPTWPNFGIRHFAVSGAYLWVTDGYGWVFQLNSGTGSLVRTLHITAAVLPGTDGIVVAGGKVWLADGIGNSVTELNASNGSLVRVIHAPADKLSNVTDVAVSGGHVWVTNGGNNSVTELNASNGSLMRVIQ